MTSPVGWGTALQAER